MDILTKGIEGEKALKQWLDANGLAYLYIDQSTDTFASLFNNSLKRPDFLILLESIGILAVDAKNYQASGGVYTLSLESEFQKALTFERVFRLPLWYAYKGNEGDNSWFWISALKAIEVGEIRVNSSNGNQFLAIKIEHFEKISTNNDLGKLYTHRLPKLEGIPKSPVELLYHPEHTEKGPPSEHSKNIDELHVGGIYSFSRDYDQKRINRILLTLTKEVEFHINYRKGTDDYFSTEEPRIDNNVIAIIDYLSTEMLSRADNFSKVITIDGENTLDKFGFVTDHLLYAVSHVFYDDKSQAWYQIYIDEDKLTQDGLKIVNDLREETYIVEIEIFDDYILFGNLA